MTCCGPKTTPAESIEKSLNLSISKTLSKDCVEFQGVPVLLFLGTGESGKSTFFKQLKVLNNMTNRDVVALRRERISIQHMIIKDIVDIVRASEMPAIRKGASELAWSKDAVDLNDGEPITPFLVKKRMGILCSADGIDTSVFEFSPDAAKFAAAIWTDPLGVHVFKLRHLFQIGDHVKFFLDRVLDIGNKNWLPDDQDIVRARVKTVGVIEQKLLLNGQECRLVDVGGQRSERRKWINHFSMATAIMFVVAASEYNSMCVEDNTTPRMTESLNVFEDVCRHVLLHEAGVIVFFNKMDVLRDQLARFPFAKYVKDYDGDGTEASVCKYLGDKYQKIGRTAFLESGCTNTNRILLFHFTTAINRENVENVFAAVLEVIIMAQLKQGQIL